MPTLLQPAKAFLLRHGLRVERVTSTQRLQDFIATLRPMRNQKGLRRFGANGDGGYLMPDDLDGVAALISLGVSDECSFDLALAQRGVPVYMADASVDGPPLQHENFNFFKTFIKQQGGGSSETLQEFCARAPKSGDLVLQMDIEGDEYGVLRGAPSELLHRFRTMIIEFHDFHFLVRPNLFNEVSMGVRRILETHHVVHIHPNNCSPMFRLGEIEIPPTIEITFYRKDCDQFTNAVGLQYPRPDDFDNVPSKPSVRLPPSWLSS